LDGASANYTDLGVARRFGSASAAYSLRDIGAMNGSVVRVRREPHDTDPTIDDEENFSANQVSSGVLEDWVNGKLESTLPADVATAAAAYSLRKVKDNYTGNAVRIRRSSDDIEVNVAFDSDNKVSLSSPITDGGTELTPNPDADLGSTSATDLNGFLNDEHESTIGHFSAGATFYHLNITNVTKDGVVAKKYSASEDATGTNQFLAVNSSAFDVRAGSGVVDSTRSKAVYKFRYYVDSTESPNVNYFHFKSQSGGGHANFTEGTVWEVVKDSWQTLTLTLPAGQTGMSDAWYIFVSDRNTNQKPSAGSITIGQGFYITPTHQVTFSNTTAFVHTWYDQAGSNNATQATASIQPKIAEIGSLLDGIKFNADVSGSSPDFLETDSKLGDSTDFFIATVIGEAQGQDAFGGIITSRSASDEGFAFGLNGSEKAQAFIYSSGGNTNDTSDEVVGTPKRLLSLDKDSTTINGNVNSDGAFTFTSNTMGSITEDKSFIGVGGRTDTTPTTLGLRANINELIFYETDQAANRFLIESEINNYYNLYNDEYEWDDATNTEWQNNVQDGVTSSFVSNGKDGFTITATGDNITSFKYKNTSPSIATNDYYKVSFNVDDPDGLFEDAQLRLTATGSGATAQTITNGFNSLSLRTGASFEYMSINSDANGSSKTATLSDFKISRIARDGFVETLYDQSGNDRDMTQDVAGSQPSIVKNGGIVKTNNGFIALQFDGTDDFIRTGDYTPAAASGGGLTQFALMCVTGRPPTVTQRVVASCGSQEGSHVIGGFYFSNNETSGQPTKQDIRFNISENGVTTPTTTSHIDQKIITATPLQDTNLLSFNRVASDNTFESFTMAGTKLTGTSLIPKTGQSASLGADFKIGASMFHGTGRKYYTGEILEVILFEPSDKRDDAPDINSNLKHYYDI
jgi:hypothetical protein